LQSRGSAFGVIRVATCGVASGRLRAGFCPASYFLFGSYLSRGRLFSRSAVRMGDFAKPLHGLTPVPRDRIPPSSPASLNCRDIPPAFPPKYAKHVQFSRFFQGQPDYRERTAPLRMAPLSGFSPQVTCAVRFGSFGSVR
jgi:hypothetical protein